MFHYIEVAYDTVQTIFLNANPSLGLGVGHARASGDRCGRKLMINVIAANRQRLKLVA